MATKKSAFGSIFGIEPAEAKKLLDKLTPRQSEAAELMATGMPNSEIAKEMKISTKTLDIHRLSLKDVLRARTAGDVVRIWLAAQFAE